MPFTHTPRLLKPLIAAVALAVIAAPAASGERITEHSVGQSSASPATVLLDPAIAAAVADHSPAERLSERSFVPLDPAIAAAIRTHRQSDRISEQSFGHGRVQSAAVVPALQSMRSSSPSLGASIALAVAALAAAIGVGVGIATGTVALGSRFGGRMPRRRRQAGV